VDLLTGGILNVNSGINVTASNITSTAGNAGTLTFSGNSTVTGTIGATKSIATVNVGNGTVTLNGSTYQATSTVFSGASSVLKLAVAQSTFSTTLSSGTSEGTVQIPSGVSMTFGNVFHATNKISSLQVDSGGTATVGTVDLAGSLNLSTGGTVNVSTGGVINASDVVSTGGVGSLIFAGTGTVNSNVGNSATIALVRLNGASTVTMNGNTLKATSTSFNNASAVLQFSGGGTTTTTTAFSSITGADAGTISITNNTPVTFNGSFSSTTNQKLSSLTIASGSSATLATDLNLAGSVDLLTGGILNVNSGSNITASNITSTAGNAGTLTFSGNSTVTGTIGATKSIATVNVGNGTVTLNGSTYQATSTVFSGASSVLKLAVAQSTFSTTLSSGTSQGTVQVPTGVSMTFGNVFHATNKISSLQVDSGGTATVGTVDLAGSLNLSTGGTVNVNNGGVINATDIAPTTTNTGTLNIVQGATISGNIGNGNIVNALNMNGAGTLSFGGSSYNVTTTSFTNSSAAVSFDSAATITTTFTGNSMGTVIANATGVSFGDVFHATKKIATLQVNASKSATVNNDVNLAANIDLTTGGALTVATGVALNAVDIKSTSGNAGTLTFAGNSTVSSTVGSAGSLATVNVGSGTVTLNKSTYQATSTIFGNSAGILNFNSGSATTITSAISSGTGLDAGTISVTNNTPVTFNGSFSSTANQKLSSLTIASGSSATLATNLNLAANVDLLTGGTLVMNAGYNLTASNVTSTSGGAGILTFNGASTVTGTIGATKSIATVNVGSGAVTLNGATYQATSTIFGNSAGMLNFNSGATTTVTTALSSGTGLDAGTVSVTNNTAVTFNGSFSSTANQRLATLTIASGSSATLATDLNLAGNVDLLTGGTLVMNAGYNLTASNVTSTSGGAGILTFNGASTVTGTIGATKSLATVNVGNGTVTLNGSTYQATSTTFTGASSVLKLGVAQSTFNTTLSSSTSQGTVQVPTGVSMTFGNVFSSGSKISSLQVDSGGTATVGTVDLAGSLNLSTGGTVNVSNGGVINATDIAPTTTNTGTLNIVQGATISGNIGNGNIVNALNMNGAGTLSFGGSSYNVTTTSFTNSSAAVSFDSAATITTTFTGNSMGTVIANATGVSFGDVFHATKKIATLQVNASKSATVNNDVNLSGNIDLTTGGALTVATGITINASDIKSTSGGAGTLTFNGNSTVNSTVGSGGSLATVNVGSGTVTLTKSTYKATDTKFGNNAGILQFNSGLATTITSAFSSNAGSDGGIIEVAGNTPATFSGSFNSASNSRIGGVRVQNGSTATFDTDLVASGDVDLVAGGILIVNNGKNVTVADVKSNGNLGQIEFKGGSNFTGNIGAAASVALVNLSGAGTVNFAGSNYNAPITSFTAGSNLRFVTTTPTTVSTKFKSTVGGGNVIVATPTDLALGDVFDATDKISGLQIETSKSATVNNDVNLAGNIDLTTGGALTVATGITINASDIKSTSGNAGTLTFNGNSTVNSTVGSGASIATVNVGSGTVTLNKSVYKATNTNFTNSAGILQFNSGSATTLTSDFSSTSGSDGGMIELAGNTAATFSGSFSSAVNSRIGGVRVQNGSTATFDTDLVASGDVDLVAGGILVVNNGRDVTVADVKSNGDFGQIIFNGNSNFTGNIGAGGAISKVTLNNGTVNFTGDIYNVTTNTTYFANAGSVFVFNDNSSVISVTSSFESTAGADAGKIVVGADADATFSGAFSAVMNKKLLNFEVKDKANALFNTDLVLGGNLTLSADSTTTISAGYNASLLSILPSSDGQGELIFGGNNILNASIGSASLATNKVTLAAGTTEITGTIMNSEIVEFGDASTNLKLNPSTNISVYGEFKSTTGADAGSITVNRNNVYFYNIFSANKKINKLTVNDSATATFGTDLLLGDTMSIGNNALVVVEAGKNVEVPYIVASSNNVGTMKFLGASVVSADIGASGKNIKTMNLNNGGVEFDGNDLYVTDLIFAHSNASFLINKSQTIISNLSATGGDVGHLIVANNQNITFNGTTSAISGNRLQQITLGTGASFSSNSNINLVNKILLGANSKLIVANNMSLTVPQILPTSNNLATLDFTGNSTVSGSIGDINLELNLVKLNNGTLSLQGNKLYAENVQFNHSNSILTTTNSIDIHANFSGQGGDYGQISILGASSSITGAFNSNPGERVKKIYVQTGSTLNVDSNVVLSENIDFGNTGSGARLVLNSGRTITATNIGGTGSSLGEVKLTSDNIIYSNLGGSAPLNLLEIGPNTKWKGSILSSKLIKFTDVNSSLWVVNNTVTSNIYGDWNTLNKSKGIIKVDNDSVIHGPIGTSFVPFSGIEYYSDKVVIYHDRDIYLSYIKPGDSVASGVGKMIFARDGDNYIYTNIGTSTHSLSFVGLTAETETLSGVTHPVSRVNLQKGYKIYADEVSLYPYGIENNIYLADSVLNLEDDTLIKGKITTSYPVGGTAGKVGTVHILGSATIIGDMGTQAMPLKAVNFDWIDNASKKAFVTGNIYADNINFDKTSVQFTQDTVLDGRIISSNSTIDILNNQITMRSHNGSYFSGQATLRLKIDDSTYGAIYVDGAGNNLDMTQISSMKIEVDNKMTFVPRDPEDYVILSTSNGGILNLPDNKRVALKITPPNALFIDWVYEDGKITRRLKENAFDVAAGILNQEIDNAINPDLNKDVLKGNATRLMDEENQENAKAIGYRTIDYMISAPKELREAYSNMATVGYQIADSNFDNSRDMMYNMSSRLHNLRSGVSGRSSGDGDESFMLKHGFWASTTFDSAQQKAKNFQSGYKSSMLLNHIGYDAIIDDKITMGALFGTSISFIHHRNANYGDKSSVKTRMIGMYSEYRITARWFLQNTMSYGISAVANKEKRGGSNTREYAYAKYRNKFGGLGAILGYDYAIFTSYLNPITVTPILGLEYNYVDTIKYKEFGTRNQNLVVRKEADDKLDVVYGLQVKSTYKVGNFSLSPELHANYRHNRLTSPTNLYVTIPGLTEPLITRVFEKNEVMKTIGAALGIKQNDFETVISYDHNYSRGYSSHQATLKLKVNL
jgi:ribosomal 50S subunit-recycling heat shock protein